MGYDGQWFPTNSPFQMIPDLFCFQWLPTRPRVGKAELSIFEMMLLLHCFFGSWAIQRFNGNGTIATNRSHLGSYVWLGHSVCLQPCRLANINLDGAKKIPEQSGSSKRMSVWQDVIRMHVVTLVLQEQADFRDRNAVQIVQRKQYPKKTKSWDFSDKCFAWKQSHPQARILTRSCWASTHRRRTKVQLPCG